MVVVTSAYGRANSIGGRGVRSILCAISLCDNFKWIPERTTQILLVMVLRDDDHQQQQQQHRLFGLIVCITIQF